MVGCGKSYVGKRNGAEILIFRGEIGIKISIAGLDWGG